MTQMDIRVFHRKAVIFQFTTYFVLETLSVLMLAVNVKCHNRKLIHCPFFFFFTQCSKIQLSDCKGCSLGGGAISEATMFCLQSYHWTNSIFDAMAINTIPYSTTTRYDAEVTFRLTPTVHPVHKVLMFATILGQLTSKLSSVL